MADAEEAFVAHMLTQSAVTNLVRQRVYAHEAGDDAIESYIVVTNSSNPMGAFTQTAYGGDARISIYCYAGTVEKARELGHVVRDLYKQHTGSVDAVTVEWIEVSNARLIYGPGREFRYLVDLIVHYT